MKVINLHLELQADLNEEELAILKKHGNRLCQEKCVNKL